MTRTSQPKPTDRKRPVNLTLSEDVVAQARDYTANLSATVEDLLAGYIASRREARDTQLEMAQACVGQWNAVNDAVGGSFADEHSTL
ncbi:MAG: type II toxin-antitoxin system CcdA family antitoxin [Burkholderiales bacterium]|nr:type II toxin-antitoxin system CcdA family antitoxin [Burkholderiales bacterium]